MKQHILARCKSEDIIITGGAAGADSLAESIAHELNMQCIVYRPRFMEEKTPYRVQDYHDRNRKIVDECDYVIAFWDKISKGTKSTIDYAINIKKPVYQI